MAAISRRRWLQGLFVLPLLRRRLAGAEASGVHFSVAEFDRLRILRVADGALQSPDIVLTTQTAPDRSGTQRFFFCDATLSVDGDVSGSVTHADLLVRMTTRVAAFTTASRLKPGEAYLEAARKQLRAWCIEPKTRMMPTLENEVPAAAKSLEIDLRTNPLRFTLALAEWARAASFVCAAPDTDEGDAAAVRGWAAELLRWFTESERGTIARDSTRQDAIFWTVQAAELARFTRNDTVLRECGHRFKDKLLRQLSLDGYFPYVLTTRRAYAESMLLLECMASIAESITTPFDSAWAFALPDGRGMRPAVAWALPFLQSRTRWPYPADVRNFSRQPERENALLFAGRAWNRQDYVDLWKKMEPDAPDGPLHWEHPITQPALWAIRPPA